jgi:transcriptional regulator with XRE-family HTH domain
VLYNDYTILERRTKMNNLKKIRGRKCISSTELCKMMNITRQSLWNYETKTLPAKTAVKFAEVLGVNVFELLGKDALTLLPLTQEDKDFLIATILED